MVCHIQVMHILKGGLRVSGYPTSSGPQGFTLKKLVTNHKNTFTRNKERITNNK